MSTKVAKVSKTSTKPVSNPVSKGVPAKAVSKAVSKEVPAKVEPKSPKGFRISEEDKKANTDDYILNPKTEKCVKKDTPLGKKLVKAEETGEEVPKTMTETERLILVVETLRDQLDLEDSAIKASLKTIVEELPRGFPVSWGGKQKTSRSPDHPKQPSNAYIYYTQDQRKKLTDKNLTNTELVSLMAKMWGETTEEHRTKYNDLAAADKIRYETEMKVFEAEHPDQVRAKSSPGKPTKASAYHKYCEQNRDAFKKENLDLDGKAITKLLADQWKEVQKDEDELAKYQSLADESNEGFEERVIEYHKRNLSKKLSEAEQKKANDPDDYELNTKTGRFVEKSKVVAKKASTVTKVAAEEVA